MSDANSVRKENHNGNHNIRQANRHRRGSRRRADSIAEQACTAAPEAEWNTLGNGGGLEMLFAAPLGEVAGTDREKEVTEAISEFVCKDKDVEYFLKNKAFEFEKRDKSRTYLVFDDETQALVAYFTLSLKSLEFRDNLSKSKVKEIDGFSKEVKGVAIALVGQFGKDEIKATEVSGKQLFDLCMEIVYQVHTLIGGRYVLIECRDTEKVVDFYRDNSFELLQLDKSDDYLQMIRRL
jgi:hypothetical protein